MKIYTRAYLTENLGDDLFIKILIDRYKKHQFYSISRGFKNYTKGNLKVYSNPILFDIIEEFKLEKYLSNKCDLAISIGGSMYMENEKYIKDYSFGKNKYYVLGSNFGPYKTQEYYNKVYDFFKNAEDVCFREEYSYNLFKDLPNVRYASDIVFNLDIKDVKNTNRKKAIFSIISCADKIGIQHQNDYENKIIELIKFLKEKQYEICLMSFCKWEKDEEAIKSISKKCKEEGIEDIEHYYYRGKIEEALDVIGDSSIMIGSRFHANIIALLLGKPIIPVIYSEKTKNVLNDMNLDVKIIDIKELKDFDVATLTDRDLNFKHDMSEAIKNAEKQFEKLDLVLN